MSPVIKKTNSKSRQNEFLLEKNIHFLSLLILSIQQGNKIFLLQRYSIDITYIFGSPEEDGRRKQNSLKKTPLSSEN